MDRPQPLGTGINGNRVFGEHFVWGPVDQLHTVGRYTVIEFRVDESNLMNWTPETSRHGQKAYMVCIDGRKGSRSYDSLDSALVGGIAIHRAGLNTQADRHFDLMTLGVIPTL